MCECNFNGYCSYQGMKQGSAKPDTCDYMYQMYLYNFAHPAVNSCDVYITFQYIGFNVIEAYYYHSLANAQAGTNAFVYATYSIGSVPRGHFLVYGSLTFLTPPYGSGIGASIFTDLGDYLSNNSSAVPIIKFECH